MRDKPEICKRSIKLWKLKGNTAQSKSPNNQDLKIVQTSQSFDLREDSKD